MKYTLFWNDGRTTEIGAVSLYDATLIAGLMTRGEDATLTGTADRGRGPCVTVDMRAITDAWNAYARTMETVSDMTGEIWDEIEEDAENALDEAESAATAYLWSKIDTKPILDTDGFWTEYSLWAYGPDQFFTFYGDTDIYSPDARPEEGPEYWELYSDWSGDSEREALEWFDAYQTEE